MSFTARALAALVLSLAGLLARQRKTPETAGTLPTHTPLFVTLLVGTVLLVCAPREMTAGMFAWRNAGGGA